MYSFDVNPEKNEKKKPNYFSVMNSKAKIKTLEDSRTLDSHFPLLKFGESRKNEFSEY